MDMQMTNRVPDWVAPIAWTYIALSLLTTALLAFDVYGRRRHHSDAADKLVWVTSALYLGPFALPLYRRHGRTQAAHLHAAHAGAGDAGQPPAALAGLPGGGASAVAHLIGVPLVIASGITIAGTDLWVMILVIGALAIALLVLYELSARSTGRRSGGRTDGPTDVRRNPAMLAAVGAATATVLAFDIGMGGWMLLLHFNEYMPPATEGSFWFLMQIGIIFGLATGHPVASRLARKRRNMRTSVTA